MSPQVCPQEGLLLRFLLGRLSMAENSELNQHFLHCKRCVARAETLDANDVLTDALRGGTPDDRSDLDEVALDRAIESALSLALPSVETNEPSQEADLQSILCSMRPVDDNVGLARLGNYRLDELLGMGGMGAVFRARDEALQRDVALKVMLPRWAEHQVQKRRFLREARASAAVSHENVVVIHEVGECDDVPYIAMQYRRGETLRDLLRRENRLDQQRAVQIARDVASALAAAHHQGVVHRDMKPENVFLLESTGRAVVLDFGLVHQLGEPRLTQAGRIVGTPKYMAPEQARSNSVDKRSDLFSLGGVIYRMLVGRSPFERNNVTATLLAITQGEYTRINDACADVSPALAHLINELLASDPNLRPANASLVAERLETIATDSATGAQTSPGRIANQSKPGGSKLAKLAGTASLLLAVAVFAWIRVSPVNLNRAKVESNIASVSTPPALAIAPFDTEQARVHQTAWANYLGDARERTIDLGDDVTMPLVLIPPGEFAMGTAESEIRTLVSEVHPLEKGSSTRRILGESPQHQVRITEPFWIGKFEVTRRQYRRFVDATNYFTEQERSGAGGMGWKNGVWQRDPAFLWSQDYFPEHDDAHPVVQVAWKDAEAFCRWVSRRCRVPTTLPSEAQWEFACRAGTTTRYSFGDAKHVLPQFGWGAMMGREISAHRVGRLEPNPFGLFDMHGNVFEWCADWYATYDSSPVQDPVGPPKGQYRVLRGGAFMKFPTNLRSAYRGYDLPGPGSAMIGFRIVCNASFSR